MTFTGVYQSEQIRKRSADSQDSMEKQTRKKKIQYSEMVLEVLFSVVAANEAVLKNKPYHIYFRYI